MSVTFIIAPEFTDKFTHIHIFTLRLTIFFHGRYTKNHCLTDN